MVRTVPCGSTATPPGDAGRPSLAGEATRTVAVPGPCGEYVTRITKSQSLDSAETTSELPSMPKSPNVAFARLIWLAHVNIRACLNVKYLRRIRDVAGQIVIRWDGCVGVRH